VRIVDHASTSHTGKVRRTNEDSFLDEPPLFVVADGMGGARAGELASRLAVDTFRELPVISGESAEDRLRRMDDPRVEPPRARAGQERPGHGRHGLDRDGGARRR